VGLARWGGFRLHGAGFQFSLGCIQALQCNKNTCPTGITTHNPKLQKGLHPPAKAQRVATYVKNMNHEVGIIAHACGVRSPRELRRIHPQVVQPNGLTSALSELYPEVEPRAQGAADLCVIAARAPRRSRVSERPRGRGRSEGMTLDRNRDAVMNTIATRAAGFCVVLLTVATADHGRENNGFDLSGSLVPGEEVHLGGPSRDGIPAIDRPRFVSARDADFLDENDPVLGLARGGLECRVIPRDTRRGHPVPPGLGK
jgi:hypothetical protein